MTLGSKQEAFLRSWSVFLVYVLGVICPKFGVTVREGEGVVVERRKARERQTQTTFLDGEHIAGSTHYARLARHLIFFRDGKPIWDSEDPVYLAAGTLWESLHPDARWGGRFSDGVHFSFEHRGVK